MGRKKGKGKGSARKKARRRRAQRQQESSLLDMGGDFGDLFYCPSAFALPGLALDRMYSAWLGLALESVRRTAVR